MTKRLFILSALTAGAALAAADAFAADAAAGPSGKWETGIAAGLNLTSGNSETLSGTASLLSEKKTEKDTYRAGVEGAYGESENQDTGEDDKNVENAKVFAGYRHLLDERLYALIDASLGYDDIADVDYRLIVSPGLGYYLMKDAACTLGVEAGPAYIREEVGGEEDDILALRLAERYDRKLSDTAKVWQGVEYLPDVSDFGNYLLNAEIGVEAALNARMSLRLAAKDTYDSEPAEGREKNDLSVTGSLVYKL